MSYNNDDIGNILNMPLDIDEKIRQILNIVNSVKESPSYGKIIRFEYTGGSDIYPRPLTDDTKDIYICFSQEKDNIHVFADFIYKRDYIEYICKGNLDQLLRPHILIRDEWSNENYDVLGSDIREWETVTFDKEWLKHQQIEFYEEMEAANDFGGVFKLKIVFDCGKEFIAEGFTYNNKNIQDLTEGIFSDYNILRLLGTWGFSLDDIQQFFASYYIENEWWKAKLKPYPLISYWKNGVELTPTNRPVNTRENNIIEFSNFVVRTNLFYCNKNHSLEDITAIISILQNNGKILEESVSAGYCHACNCYFLLEHDYFSLQKKGVLLCQLLSYEEYIHKGIEIMQGKELKAQSILRRCGYTVNNNDALSIEQRQKILALVIDNNLYSATGLCGFLDWLISFHGKKRNKNMNTAIEKWKEDRAFVSQYKTDHKRKIGIKSITT